MKEFTANPFGKGNNKLFPPKFQFTEEGVKLIQQGVFKGKEFFVKYADIKDVTINTPMLGFASILIRGGEFTSKDPISGFTNVEVKRMKELAMLGKENYQELLKELAKIDDDDVDEEEEENEDDEDSSIFGTFKSAFSSSPKSQSTETSVAASVGVSVTASVFVSDSASVTLAEVSSVTTSVVSVEAIELSCSGLFSLSFVNSITPTVIPAATSNPPTERTAFPAIDLKKDPPAAFAAVPAVDAPTPADDAAGTDDAAVPAVGAAGTDDAAVPAADAAGTDDTVDAGVSATAVAGAEAAGAAAVTAVATSVFEAPARKASLPRSTSSTASAEMPLKLEPFFCSSSAFALMF